MQEDGNKKSRSLLGRLLSPRKKKEPGKWTYLYSVLIWLLVSAMYVAGIHYHILSTLAIIAGGIFLLLFIAGPVLYFTGQKKLLKSYNRLYLVIFILVIIALTDRFFWPDSGDWKPYTFEDELAQIESQRTIPDEENAAFLYDALFSALDTDVNEPDFFAKCDPQAFARPWTKDEHPEFQDCIDEYTDVIEQLKTISLHERCRWPVEKHLFAESPDRHDKFRFCGKLLAVSANGDTGAGRTGSGVEKCLCLLRMADHCYQQPQKMDHFIGGCIRKRALTIINHLVVEGSDVSKYLPALADAVSVENTWHYDCLNILEIEKLQTKNLYGGLYETNSAGQVRFTRNLVGTFVADSDNSSPSEQWFQNRMAYVVLPAFAPYHPRTGGRAIDAAYAELHAVAEQAFKWDTFHETVKRASARTHRLNGVGFIHFTLWEVTQCWDLDGYHDFHTRTTAMQRGSRIIIALRTYREKNGRWPDSLEQIRTLVPQEALSDPFNNREFVYRRDDASFQLYSVGKNALDEFGKYDRSWRSSDGADDRPIWPPEPQ